MLIGCASRRSRHCHSLFRASPCRPTHFTQQSSSDSIGKLAFSLQQELGACNFFLGHAAMAAADDLTGILQFSLNNVAIHPKQIIDKLLPHVSIRIKEYRAS